MFFLVCFVQSSVCCVLSGIAFFCSSFFYIVIHGIKEEMLAVFDGFYSLLKSYRYKCCSRDYVEEDVAYRCVGSFTGLLPEMLFLLSLLLLSLEIPH